MTPLLSLIQSCSPSSVLCQSSEHSYNALTEFFQLKTHSFARAPPARTTPSLWDVIVNVVTGRTSKADPYGFHLIVTTRINQSTRYTMRTVLNYLQRRAHGGHHSHQPGDQNGTRLMLTTLSGRSEREFNNKVMSKNMARKHQSGWHLLLHHGRAGG